MAQFQVVVSERVNTLYVVEIPDDMEPDDMDANDIVEEMHCRSEPPNLDYAVTDRTYAWFDMGDGMAEAVMYQD